MHRIAVYTLGNDSIQKLTKQKEQHSTSPADFTIKHCGLKKVGKIKGKSKNCQFVSRIVANTPLMHFSSLTRAASRMATTCSLQTQAAVLRSPPSVTHITTYLLLTTQLTTYTTFNKSLLKSLLI